MPSNRKFSLSYAEARFRVEAGLAGKWESLSENQKGILRKRAVVAFDKFKTALTNLDHSNDPLAILSRASGLLDEVFPPPDDD